MMSTRSMVRACLGLAVWMLASPAWSAATLSGVVSLGRERGRPIAGVEISARGANVVTTGNDGIFVLTFRDGRPGQEVSIRVNHPGWEVVNDILLDQRLPENPNTRTFEIIICPIAERGQRVAEFYRVKGNQAVEQTYRTKLGELERRQAATAQERDRLRHERDQALKQVEEWARQSAAHKPEEVGGTYREALRLFVEGKADAALQVLSDDRLQQEADKAQEQLKQGWLLKGQLLRSKFDYNGAGRAYEKAVEMAPGVFEAWFAYANFHREQNHFAQARRGYEQALSLARLASNEANVAVALNQLGDLSHVENRMADARTQHEEALAILRTLAKANPEYLRDVAIALNHLGVLNQDENRMADARTQFEETLAILRTLAKKDPEYLPHVATTLNNLGGLSQDERRVADARKQFEEALDIRRTLAKTNPDVHLPDVATTLNNLGNLNYQQRRMTDARKQIEEALAIYRALAKTNPDVHLPDVVDTLNNLGALSREEGWIVDAGKQAEKALAIYRTLAKTAPDVYLPYVASTLNHLGFVSHNENRDADARTQYEEALAIQRALAKTNPDVYLPHVADTLKHLGFLSHGENRKADARKYFEEALGILRKFAERAPTTYQPLVQAVEDQISMLPE